MINNATDQDLAVDDLMAAYDADEDGVLSEDEAIAALADNRPEDTSPLDQSSKMGGAFVQMAGIDNYLKMASMAAGNEQSENMFGMLGSANGAISAGSKTALNTRI
ncbi:uncharacterized protein Dvar_62790 [Desulfosarcina variabilis str. Montpellier]|uniref:hypothetical protein n=1 Tax=Desulfosarcina variabilis TaxID=2300 RepID=UPI003AFB0305